MQPNLRLAVALTALALAACVDSQSPEIRAPESNTPEVAPRATKLPTLPADLLQPSLQTFSRRSRKGYDITLRFLTPTTPSQRAAFSDAVDRWEHQITGEKPDDSEGIPPDFCGILGVPGFTGTIDDLLIDVILAPIDGPGTPEEGNILGAAGPCAVRTSDLLSVYGIMFFDTFDLGDIEADGILDEVILHEMGHVLGFGTLWDLKIKGFPKRNLLRQEKTSHPIFIGERANRGYKRLGGKGSVPVEADFGPGTALGHWDEDTFGNELMTGFIALGESPLSDVTAGSMIDLGYVGTDRGEPYQLPTLEDAAMSASRIGLGGLDLAKHEILIKPKDR